MNVQRLRWFNTIAFVFMIAVNFLGEVLPIGSGTTGEISAQYQTLITPAPITFSIWGIIYLLMTAFLLYQWGVFSSRTRSDEIIKAVGPLFALSCLINSAWIFAWHFEKIGLSALLIAGLLVTLVFIQRRLSGADSLGVFRKVIKAGFSIYLGWIIAATIVNIGAFLVSISWNGFGLSDAFWISGVLLIGSFIGSLASILKDEIFTTMAIIWAYVGILIRQFGEVWVQGESTVAIVFSFISIGIMLVMMVYSIIARSDRLRIVKAV